MHLVKTALLSLGCVEGSLGMLIYDNVNSASSVAFVLPMSKIPSFSEVPHT